MGGVVKKFLLKVFFWFLRWIQLMVWTVTFGAVGALDSERDPLMKPGLGFLKALFVIPNHQKPKPLLEVDDFGYSIPNLPGFLKPCLFFFVVFHQRFVGQISPGKITLTPLYVEQILLMLIFGLYLD